MAVQDTSSQQQSENTKSNTTRSLGSILSGAFNSVGSGLRSVNSWMSNDSFLGEGITNGALVNAGMGALNMGVNMLAGQNQSGVGNALQTIGGLASNIPGVGGLIGAGVGVVGGLVNAAFGSHINEEFVQQTQLGANQVGSQVFNANTNGDLLNDWQNMTQMSNVSKSEVGSDGWFSNKASNKTRELNEKINAANQRQLANFNIAAQNVDTSNDLRILQNMAAYGGPINSFRKYYADGGEINTPQFFTFEPQAFAKGGYLNQAKALIRQNEGWRDKPYSDTPKGKNWRSVGYGFNDSGFREKYPEGISKHYEHGITKKQAEEELDYFLNKAEKQLKSIYGKQWNDFTDSQKAAILDTYYQRPASVGKSSRFYKAVTAGEDAGRYLGVAGYDRRNKIRQDIFGGDYSGYSDTESNPSPLQEVTPFTPVVHDLDLSGITPTEAKALELNLTSPTFDLSMFGKPMTIPTQQAVPTVGTVEDFLASYEDFEDNLFREGGSLFEDGGYKIPKKRTRIKTIRINNGILIGEADNQGKMYWFRNGKYITPNQLKSYKYYDPSVKGYRTLGDKATYISNKGAIEFIGVKTPLYRPTYEGLVKRGTEKQTADYKREKEQNIPLQNQKWITLRTKGKMNLADVPLNMLDSIAVNAGRSNTDFWTDAALIGKESTFAGFSKALNSPYSSTITGVSPHELTNNHAWYNNPEQDYISAINRNYKSFNEKEQIEAENNMKYALEHGLVKNTTPRYSDYILADAFKRYQAAPTRYNPGQKNYVPMLNGIRQELLGEKQLQEYWNTKGKQEYERGQQEGMANGGKLNINDMNIFDFGGGLTHGVTFDTGVDWVNEGGSHGENPYGGVMVGSDEEGIPNLVEEGEAIWNGDYVFSKRMKVPKKLAKKYGLGGDMTFADAIAKLTKESEERPLDNISRRTQDHILGEFADSQEELRAAKAQRAMEKEQQLQEDFLTGVQFGLGGALFADGGSIHIDPSKRGTFKAQASKMGMGVQEAASHILANKENYSPAMVKKANFARNASHWHDDGGSLFENPFGEVNTFDGGGYMWDLFWQKTNASSKKKGNSKLKYRIDDSYTGDIKALEDSEQYKAFTNYILNEASDEERLKYFRWIDDNTGRERTYTNKKGELIDGWQEKFKAARNDGLYGIQHYTPVKNAGTTGTISLTDLFGTTPVDTDMPEQGLLVFDPKIMGNPKAMAAGTRSTITDPNGTKVTRVTGDGTSDNGLQRSPFKPKQTWTRYAPLVMSGLMGLKEILTPADYGNADSIMEAAYQVGSPVSIGTEYLGDYRKRDPFDERYLMNLINQRGAATNRNMMNLSGGNRAAAMAGIFSNDLTTQMSLAEAARQSYLANRADDAQVAEFNRGTNQFNATAQNQRNQFLAGLNSQRQQAMLSGISQGARLRQAIKDQRDAAIYGNLSNFAQGLGDIGWENSQYNMMGGLADEDVLKYIFDKDFITTYKNRLNKNNTGEG